MRNVVKAACLAAACTGLAGCPLATSVKGTVTTGAGAHADPVSPGRVLSPLSRVTVADGASITIRYGKAGACTFDGPVEFVVGDGKRCSRSRKDQDERTDQDDPGRSQEPGRPRGTRAPAAQGQPTDSGVAPSAGTAASTAGTAGGLTTLQATLLAAVGLAAGKAAYDASHHHGDRAVSP